MSDLAIHHLCSRRKTRSHHVFSPFTCRNQLFFGFWKPFALPKNTYFPEKEAKYVFLQRSNTNYCRITTRSYLFFSSFTCFVTQQGRRNLQIKKKSPGSDVEHRGFCVWVGGLRASGRANGARNGPAKRVAAAACEAAAEGARNGPAKHVVAAGVRSGSWRAERQPRMRATSQGSA